MQQRKKLKIFKEITKYINKLSETKKIKKTNVLKKKKARNNLS